jgi:L-aminopeptidase/D-esterase-like protein
MRTQARLVCAGLLAASALLRVLPSSAVERARDLGVPFVGTPGPLNSITDVAGVEVGQTTLIRGSGRLITGQGPVRTGVTVIHPLGKAGRDAVAAGRATLNGTGEWTGLNLVEELGQLYGPIALTGTGNLSLVHQAMIDWAVRSGRFGGDELIMRLLPVVGETLDFRLNDVFGHPMTEADVFAALDNASAGPVAEGNVGGGTGMVAYQFKGGIGTASRAISVNGRRYTVGVLLQANNGNRKDLRIAGIPIGEEIADLLPGPGSCATGSASHGKAEDSGAGPAKSSLLVVIATDVPLDSRQLARLARWAALGIGRTGGTSNDFSGEFALAFSTTSTFPWGMPSRAWAVADTDEELMNAIFEATVESVEEATVNQLVASQTMQGINGMCVFGLPHERLIQSLVQHHRWQRASRAAS